MKKNILILYTNSGTGYYMASKAIEEKIKNIYPNSNILLIDPLDYSRPLLNKIINVINNFISRKFKKLKKKINDNKNISNYLEESSLYSLFSVMFWSKKLEKKLLDFNPEIIFSVHSEVSILISKHKHLFNAKIISVLTDYEINSTFTVPHKIIDLFLVPNVSSYNNAIKFGIDESKVIVSGMPVRNQFINVKIDKVSTLKKYYINTKKQVFLFVIGNGYGRDKMLNYFEEILKSSLDFTYILIPGSNKNIEEKAKRIAIKYNKIGKVLGYTNNMAELINASDLVIGQPGGLIISECLELNKPFCSIEPTSEKEIYNAIYLHKNNFGFNIKNINTFKTFIKKMGNIELKTYSNNIKENHVKNNFDDFLTSYKF